MITTAPVALTAAQAHAIVVAYHRPAPVGPEYPGDDSLFPLPKNVVDGLVRKGLAQAIEHPFGRWNGYQHTGPCTTHVPTPLAQDALLGMIPPTAARKISDAGWVNCDWEQTIRDTQAGLREQLAKVGVHPPHTVTVTRTREYYRNHRVGRDQERFVWHVVCHTCDYHTAVDGTSGSRHAREAKARHEEATSTYQAA